MLNNNSLSYLFIASTLSLVVYHSPISIASPVFANDYKYLVANSNSNDSDNETILVEKADLLFNEQKYEQAIKTYSLALKINANQKLQGYILHSIGRSYFRLKDAKNAINYYERALLIRRNIQDIKGEDNTLGNLALAYELQNNYIKSVEYHLQALKLSNASIDLEQQSRNLGNLARAYYYLGSYAKSLNYYQQALKVRQLIGNTFDQGKSWQGIALIYNELGEYGRAIETYQVALKILQASLNKNNERDVWNEKGRVLHNIGITYISLKKYREALDYLFQALQIREKLGYKEGEAKTLNIIGDVYRHIQQYSQSLSFLQRALIIARNVNDIESTAQILESIGTVYQLQQKYLLAFDFYQRALNISKSPYNRASIFSKFGDLFAQQKQPELAIIFYKESVNITELMRQDLRKLSKEEQKSYLNTVAERYRRLADLLLQQDRILEAQQVLDLLKVEELSEYLLNMRGNTETSKGIELQYPEQNIIALGKELAELQALYREGKLDLQQEQRLGFLTNQEKNLTNQFNAFLKSPPIQKQIEELRRTEKSQNVNIEIFNNLRGKLKEVQNAALFYPLILDDRLELILITANTTPIRKTINLKREDLNTSISTFLTNLRDPSSANVKENGQKFYNWLIKPFETELQQAKIETIIYAPDGQLRYIPLGTLHNGTQWLIENYRVNNITASSLTKSFISRSFIQPRILAAAATNKQSVKVGDRTIDFNALPATKVEVETIANLIPRTTTLIDQQFSQPETLPKMQSHSIVHLATHGYFAVGQPEDSFIVFGDGSRATLNDIENWTLTNVGLVVLSACETAINGKIGKGIEILGLGYQIQNQGAGAAIATLWKVSDGGTQKLMDAFYTAVKTGKVSHAEALRQAQVAMITGSYEGLGEARGIVSIQARPRTTVTIPAKISHPYYWAAFILIGNGL